MDYSTIVSTIGSLGFPIVACIYMAYVNAKQTESHKEEMGKVTEAVTELKIAITELTSKLTKED